MTTREKMKKFREDNDLSLKEMAERCGIHMVLLEMVEFNHVTHPNFVKRIQMEYELTDLEAEDLLPVNRRPHGPCYDPTKYEYSEMETRIDRGPNYMRTIMFPQGSMGAVHMGSIGNSLRLTQQESRARLNG